LTSAPGGAASWTLSSNELNAHGCGGGAHIGASLSFSGGRKVGSLLSENIPLAPVPEPQTYAMMLGGLVVMGAMARRRTVMKRCEVG
jgi:hypothetical protein